MLAASDRPAPAIDHEPYRALAEKMWATRQAHPRDVHARRRGRAPHRRRDPRRRRPAAVRLRRHERGDARRLAHRRVRRSVDAAACSRRSRRDDHRPRAHRAARSRCRRRGRVVPRRARPRACCRRRTAWKATASPPTWASSSPRRSSCRPRSWASSDDDDRVIEVIEYPSAPTARARSTPSVLELGFTHVGLVCDDIDATRARARGRRACTSSSHGIADVAGVRTTWFADPWDNVFILVEKRPPPRRAVLPAVLTRRLKLRPRVALRPCRGRRRRR